MRGRRLNRLTMRPRRRSSSHRLFARNKINLISSPYGGLLLFVKNLCFANLFYDFIFLFLQRKIFYHKRFAFASKNAPYQKKSPASADGKENITRFNNGRISRYRFRIFPFCPQLVGRKAPLPRKRQRLLNRNLWIFLTFPIAPRRLVLF